MDALWQGWGASPQQSTALWEALARLSCAAVLGGIVGLEREVKRKTAGLRTNMFICVGAALFTLLSRQLAGADSEQTRIASNIITGIGFIGGGAIFRARGSVTGITTAATMFVLAAIGMAAGGGYYLVAVFTTALILLALSVLAGVERRFSLKRLVMNYEVSGDDAADLVDQINVALEPEHKMMMNPQVVGVPQHGRVHFQIDGSRAEHNKVMTCLQSIPAARSVVCLGAEDPE